MSNFYIILTGSLVAMSCGILGCFLILRKMAMVGDAISHAVLPGIVLAFLWSGSRDSLTMLIGAGTLGILTTFLIEFLTHKGKLQSDASIGVTFTWLFALGVILISAFAGQVDLDQECVLYGEIALVPLDTIILASGTDIGPYAIYLLGAVFLMVVLFVSLSFNQLKITSFDPQYAISLGISATFWNYLLMSFVSFTTVASFESVGAILVVAFLIAPAATAYLLTHDLKKMIIIACLIGILSAVGGHYLAMSINGSIAGAMASVAGILFGIAFVYVKLTSKKVAKLTSGVAVST
ncbi:metal ABC transporter permease [Marivirga sp. S37H4]|uniref:Metal ABC transporter permease n=1 Tax=Marivirga aurantiaca TaxID=2802615 RepID=A0A934WW78_9BACT|nr:metal ABC transporter permease [Marivirga aurantiaca]MBK6264203.1 metal ABC transporter permease [Marivirga aurantiaca]